MKSLVEFYLWAFHGNGIQKFSRWKSNMSQNLDFFLPKKAHIDISTKKLFFHNMVPIGFEPASFLPKNAYIMFWTHNFCHEMLTLGIEPTTFAKKCSHWNLMRLWVMSRIFGIKKHQKSFFRVTQFLQIRVGLLFGLACCNLNFGCPIYFAFAVKYDHWLTLNSIMKTFKLLNLSFLGKCLIEHEKMHSCIDFRVPLFPAFPMGLSWLL